MESFQESPGVVWVVGSRLDGQDSQTRLIRNVLINVRFLIGPCYHAHV
jgi:hypothetical protein